jgi:hypothetical protein
VKPNHQSALVSQKWVVMKGYPGPNMTRYYVASYVASPSTHCLYFSMMRPAK